MSIKGKETKIYLDKNKVQSRYFYIFTKRILDIIFSLIGLIVLSPVFLIVSIWIKLCDNGPVFYVQERVKLNGKRFNIYKFRSMYVNADLLLEKLKQKNEVQGPMFKMKHDPRVTSVGRFIRKTSIDELPQLVNVLKGDMSLVGPRPPLPSEVAQYSKYDLQRLWVIPGCTGLWQATERNNVGFDEMVNLDLEYIEKSSVFFDAKIIFMTILVMFRPNSAY
ncbi:MAG: sugar transferase [Lactobacillus sp.]|nr:sugar transferase [Lactobacillus sp.]